MACAWFKCFTKNPTSEKRFRRIYKGEVPYLVDSEFSEFADKDLHISKPNVLGSSSHNAPHTTPMPSTEEGKPTRPKPVRRLSISPDTPETHKLPEVMPEKFSTNFVVTARYTIWNFLPKNLFEQFRRVVNFYFLMVALHQTFIDSPVHPVTAVSPLAFVILVTAIKQGYEDWLRHKNDDQVNNRPVKVIKDGKLQEIKAKDVQVGDIVKLETDEQVPTDMLLLGTNDEFLRCQINTANLDGETNLKLRYCPSGIPRFKSNQDFNHLHLILECEHPCEDLYDFNGSLLIPTEKLVAMHQHISPTVSATHLNSDMSLDGTALDKPTEEYEQHFPDLSSGVVRQGVTDFLSIPLSMDNMVLRGTRLKNTDYIYGLVVYTGKDTRLAKNSEKSEAKFSTVERAVNYYLIFFIVLLFVLVFFCTIMHYSVDFYPGSDEDGPWYLNDHLPPPDTRQKIKKAFTAVTSFTVLFNYIIPISLYVTVEMQKFLGSKFFVWDNDMVDDEGREPLCNTSDLNEELGQIEYLFSDKTGTLTQNVMKFRHCSIGAVRFEYKDDHKLYKTAPHGKQDEDGNLVDIFNSKEILHFFKTLALCHSVQVVPKRRQSFDAAEVSFLAELRAGKKEKSSIGSTGRDRLITPESLADSISYNNDVFAGQWEFQASSPDEKALLESCERLNVVYRGEKEDMMTLDVSDSLEQYKRLMHLEFDADRKCMSVIVENSQGEIWLYTKGAESSIIPKCDNGPCQATLKHVMDYARMGLRTLAVAQRKLTAKEYELFSSEMRTARRQLKNRQEKVREVYSSIESHMTLIGATGVEDQLQDHVPETLQSFAEAGIRVWMLTGDKLETGVNVAVACGLITTSTKQYVVSKMTSHYEVETRFSELKKKMDVSSSDDACFVIDGDSLNIAFKHCPVLLSQVSMAASRVVCCRMAPLQKAQVVQMVKNSPGNPICCAIGDGANDCAMILAAHVGIGILGKEGRQAARCADFALSKFGHARKAILVHGHWYYVRLANLANYFFYKNVVFVLPQFFFSFHSNFSTQALFNALFLMCFNIFFSSCPIFLYGLTEQPYSAEELLKKPRLYKENRKNALMTIRQFLPWLISSFWHGAVCYYVPYFAWDNLDFDDINDVMSFGMVIFTGVVICTNCKIAVETKFISWWGIGSQLCSYSSYFLFTGIYFEINLFPPADNQGVFFQVVTYTCFWLLMVLVAVISILPDLLFIASRYSWKRLTSGCIFVSTK